MALYFLVYRLKKHAQHMYYHTCNDRGNAFDSCTIALNSSRKRGKQLLQYFFKILDNLTIVLKVRHCFLKQTKHITNKRSRTTKTPKEKIKEQTQNFEETPGQDMVENPLFLLSQPRQMFWGLSGSAVNE